MQLEGKTALVTGSSRGIGRAIARELAGRGATLIVHGSKESESLRSSLKDVSKLSADSIMLTAELSEPAAIRAMFSQVEKTFDRLDILINNAATQKPGAVLDRVYLISERGSALLEYYLEPGESIDKNLYIMAEIPTALGNVFVREISYHLKISH